MRISRVFALPALLLLLTLLPGLALAAPAAPRAILLSDYRAMLQAGVAHLEQAEQLVRTGRNSEASAQIDGARPLLKGHWRVESPYGAVTADLSDLERLLRQAGEGAQPHPARLSGAAALAREHLAAADALARVDGYTEVPGARQSLERALEETRARSVYQRVQDWINSLLGRQVRRAVDADVPQYVYIAGVAIALIALTWLGFSLYRNLAGHGASPEAALRRARAGRPDRPPTPAELRAKARELSAAGEHLAALRTAHLALLQHYDQIQLIRFIPAQTNREHEWQLRRRHPHLARTLRALNDLVDDRLYSGHGATAEDFMRVEALVDQLWREGDAASKGAEATNGASSSA